MSYEAPYAHHRVIVNPIVSNEKPHFGDFGIRGTDVYFYTPTGWHSLATGMYALSPDDPITILQTGSEIKITVR